MALIGRVESETVQNGLRFTVTCSVETFRPLYTTEVLIEFNLYPRPDGWYVAADATVTINGERTQYTAQALREIYEQELRDWWAKAIVPEA